MDAHEKRRLAAACIIAAPVMGGLIYGYNLSSIAGAILFIREEFVLAPTSQQFLISAVLFGAVLGSALSGMLSDRIGRRNVLVVTSATCVVGAIGTEGTQSRRDRRKLALGSRAIRL